MLSSDRLLWILEDDADSRFILEETLGVRYPSRFFSTLLELDTALSAGGAQPTLLIADLRLPDGIFVDFHARKKQLGVRFPPFVVVSSMDDLDFLRECYRQGALDYLAKPFTKNELIAKIERLMLPMETAAKKSVGAVRGGIVLHSLRLRVEDAQGRSQQLTSKEYQILTILHQSPEFVSREHLQSRIWGDVNVAAKTLDVHIFNLRRKLAALDLRVNYHSDLGFHLEAGVTQSDVSNPPSRELT